VRPTIAHLLLDQVDDVDAAGAIVTVAGDHELAAGERRSTRTILELYAYLDPGPGGAREIRREGLRMSDPGC
jgi:hypothetical protein